MATWRDLPGIAVVGELARPVSRTVGQTAGILRSQAGAVLALPGTIAALNRSVRTLGETVAAAQEAMTSVQRVAVRVERTIDDIEEPLRALAPGLLRAAVVLDDPMIETIPEVLRQVHEQALPLLKTVVETQEKVAGIAATTDRLMTMVDDAGGRLAALPGAAALLGTLGGRRSGAERIARQATARPVPGAIPGRIIEAEPRD